MVPEHHRSALGRAGLRGFDWELWPAALAGGRPPGARADWLGIAPGWFNRPAAGKHNFGTNIDLESPPPAHVRKKLEPDVQR